MERERNRERGGGRGSGKEKYHTHTKHKTKQKIKHPLNPAYTSVRISPMCSTLCLQVEKLYMEAVVEHKAPVPCS